MRANPGVDRGDRLLELAALVAADDGHRRTDELIEKIDETVKEMREGRKRVDKTLAAYDDVFSREDKHRRSAYKELDKSLDKHEERAKKLRERFEDLDKAANKYFKEWNESLKAIHEGELRDKSAARLEDTRSGYRELVAIGEHAQEAFGPVVDGLRDQVVYLGHDLNQASVDSLEAERVRTRDNARELHLAHRRLYRRRR